MQGEVRQYSPLFDPPQWVTFRVNGRESPASLTERSAVPQRAERTADVPPG